MQAYAQRRYAGRAPPQALTAWTLLLHTLYSCGDGQLSNCLDIPTSRPGLSGQEIGLWGLKPHLWYDPVQVGGGCC